MDAASNTSGSLLYWSIGPYLHHNLPAGALNGGEVLYLKGPGGGCNTLQVRPQLKFTTQVSLAAMTSDKVVAHSPDHVTLLLDLDRPAPPGGALVRFTTNNSKSIGLNASITVPAGQVRTSVMVKTRPVQTPQKALIIAECGGSSKSVSIQINPGNMPAALLITPANAVSGATVIYGASIYHPQPVPTVFRILADFGTAPVVTIPAWKTSASVSGNAPSSPAERTINYCLSPDSSETAYPCRSIYAIKAALILKAPPFVESVKLIAAAVDKNTLYSPDEVRVTVDISLPAPANGSLVALVANSPQYLELPSSILIPYGRTRGSVTIKPRPSSLPKISS
jgi:hypothetical protein